MSPHPHFRPTDDAEPLSAKGMPRVFESYEVLRGEAWVGAIDGVPANGRQLRFAEEVP